MGRTKSRFLQLLAGVLCLFLIHGLGVTANASNAAANIVLNGKAVVFTDSTGYPYVDENGRTMVPLRTTMEAAGATVGWDQKKQTAIVITIHHRTEVPIGTNYLYDNNIKKENDTNAVVKNGRTYLPIRAVLESADFTVEWDAATRTVNAYTFDPDNNNLVPYSTSNMSNLVDNVLAGNVVYINGQYYATPDYVKQLASPQVDYMGDDLNTAIYPEPSRYDLADVEFKEVPKEWVTVSDLIQKDIIFDCSADDSYVQKGFYSMGYVSKTLYEMPSLPDDFIENPTAGVYDGIEVKIEDGVIMFHQSDLMRCGILTEPITDTVGIMPKS